MDAELAPLQLQGIRFLNTDDWLILARSQECALRQQYVISNH